MYYYYSSFANELKNEMRANGDTQYCVFLLFSTLIVLSLFKYIRTVGHEISGSGTVENTRN